MKSKKYYRRIWLRGGSTVVALPKEFVVASSLNTAVYCEVAFDYAAKTITIRRARD